MKFMNLSEYYFICCLDDSPRAHEKTIITFPQEFVGENVINNTLEQMVKFDKKLMENYP